MPTTMITTVVPKKTFVAVDCQKESSLIADVDADMLCWFSIYF